MAGFAHLFEQSLDFDPDGDFAGFLRQVPARWVVYLMCDADDRAVQLLCVKNLRYSLERRLGSDQESLGPSRRVNYRQVVRRVWWRRVDSAFEADAAYLESARQIFPDTYRGMVGFRPAWFVHVDPSAPVPRYVKTTEPAGKTGVVLGPLADKHAAGRLIELLEGVFDLCRQDYYARLLEAPHGRACAYKEMGRCPAPCDGSISMDEYRRMIADSAAAATDPSRYVRQQTQQMRQAAEALNFELAGRIKSRIDQIGQLGKGSLREVRRLEDFRFLSLQRGPKSGHVKVFLITPGRIDEVAMLVREPESSADLLRTVLAEAHVRQGETLDAPGVERIGVVTHHLLAPKSGQGVFLHLDEIDERAVIRAYRQVLKQKAEAEPTGEGVVKELQA